jgi:hypothetical protein
MKTYKIVWKNGRTVIEKAARVLDLIRKYDLSTRENISTKIIELGGDE